MSTKIKIRTYIKPGPLHKNTYTCTRIPIPVREYLYLHENTYTYTRIPMEITMVYYTQLKENLDV